MTSTSVSVTFSHRVTETNSLEIDHTLYREWLGIQPDEEFEFTTDDVTAYILDGDPVYDVTGYLYLDDFEIESVDCE